MSKNSRRKEKELMPRDLASSLKQQPHMHCLVKRSEKKEIIIGDLVIFLGKLWL